MKPLSLIVLVLLSTLAHGSVEWSRKPFLDGKLTLELPFDVSVDGQSWTGKEVGMGFSLRVLRETPDPKLKFEDEADREYAALKVLKGKRAFHGGSLEIVPFDGGSAAIMRANVEFDDNGQQMISQTLLKMGPKLVQIQINCDRAMPARLAEAERVFASLRVADTGKERRIDQYDVLGRWWSNFESPKTQVSMDLPYFPWLYALEADKDSDFVHGATVDDGQLMVSVTVKRYKFQYGFDPHDQIAETIQSVKGEKEQFQIVKKPADERVDGVEGVRVEAVEGVGAQATRYTILLARYLNTTWTFVIRTPNALAEADALRDRIVNSIKLLRPHG